MRRPRLSLLAAGAALAALVTLTVTAASATTRTSYPVRYVTISMAAPYKPVPPAGATDDYHCSLIDTSKQVTQNSYIVSSNFNPGDLSSTEVHHAILFLIPPSWTAAAEKANNNGKGWTCFGETVLSGQQLVLPGTGPPSGQPTWLTAWAPGHNKNVYPSGTGVLFPKGSMVVLQIHYNTLAGDLPIQSSLTLGTVPTAANLKPLSLDLYPAPPDVPCLPAWHPATTPLCNRANSLQYLGQRFGQQAVDFVNGLELICGRSPSNPPVGEHRVGTLLEYTTSCTWTNHRRARIVALGAHMHLTGVSFKMTLDPGRRNQRVLLAVKNFNFDYQRGYAVQPWIQIVPGDRVQVSCTYNPIIHDFNPQLQKAPKRFVTWGDGSSDEMCLGLVYSVSG
jgi:hypothetical protein